jgi:hypothetical protein
MRHETDTRVQGLCTKLLSLKDEAEVDAVLLELREALREHIRLARHSLEAQVVALSALQTVTELSKTPL